MSMRTCQMRKNRTPRMPAGNMSAERPQDPALSVRLPCRKRKRTKSPLPPLRKIIFETFKYHLPREEYPHGLDEHKADQDEDLDEQVAKGKRQN